MTMIHPLARTEVLCGGFAAIQAIDEHWTHHGLIRAPRSMTFIR